MWMSNIYRILSFHNKMKKQLKTNSITHVNLHFNLKQADLSLIKWISSIIYWPMQTILFLKNIKAFAYVMVSFNGNNTPGTTKALYFRNSILLFMLHKTWKLILNKNICSFLSNVNQSLLWHVLRYVSNCLSIIWAYMNKLLMWKCFSRLMLTLKKYKFLFIEKQYIALFI